MAFSIVELLQVALACLVKRMRGTAKRRVATHSLLFATEISLPQRQIHLI